MVFGVWGFVGGVCWDGGGLWWGCGGWLFGWCGWLVLGWMDRGVVVGWGGVFVELGVCGGCCKWKFGVMGGGLGGFGGCWGVWGGVGWYVSGGVG